MSFKVNCLKDVNFDWGYVFGCWIVGFYLGVKELVFDDCVG